DVGECEILLRKLRTHFHLAALGKPEQGARPRIDDLAELDAAREDEPCARSDDVELPDLRTHRAELCLGHTDLGIGCVARRLLRIDLRLRDESAPLKCEGAL